jgi:DNA-directed RNA polymerase subunit beta'
MRTFHTGGVAGADITQGLPRVEEIFEARPVKKSALIAPYSGQIYIEEIAGTRQKMIKIVGKETKEEELEISQSDLDKLQVKDGKKVKKGQVLLENKEGELTAPAAGVLKIEETDSDTVLLKIITEKDSEKEMPIPSGYSIWVKSGDLVNQGDQLTEGSLDLHELHHLRGIDAVRMYILKEILYIYISQGQKLNEKHIEIIIRQLFSRVLIIDSGDTEYLVGEISEHPRVMAANARAVKEKKREATFHRLLMGITKVSLSTESWLSAASFQETARVLIDAATSGKVDNLRGLKENVIIGRLIPAGTGFKEDK